MDGSIMEMRKLGNSGLSVAPLCFGGNVFGWTVDEAKSFKLLDALAASGINFIDTADVYSKWAPGNKGGESETIVGNWFKKTGKRKDVILATKVGMEMAPDRKGLAKAYILRAVEDSLKRLQTDYIDLYQSHQDDAAMPLAETLEAYAQLVKQGKVRAIGASNYTAARLAEALKTSREHGLPMYQSLQPQYNLYERAGFEAELEALCVKENVGVICFFALASGFLSGKYRSAADAGKSKRGENIVKKYLNERGFRILDALDAAALDTHTTPAQVALAWLMARPGMTAPIASATSVEQLQDLAAAASLKLDAETTAALDKASAP
jgi:aryl-alcohol dehydrogenase-like predicted oxidoreductase